ncbi:MAG: hypothetical protein WBN22_11625 [Verrucomicrobiia bacterium]
MRRIELILFAATVLLTGCRPAQSTESTTPVPSPAQMPAPSSSRQTIARVHWLGLKQLSGETNAAHWMEIWNLPESRRLEPQTLDKLSLAPWSLLHRALDTNAAALLRPLLDDVVSNESCLEIRQAANEPATLVFAIRLDDQRAALWQTNLARILESLTGIHPVPAPDDHYGWSLKKHHEPNLLELTRVGGWTIVGAAQDHNDLLNELLDRIRQGQPPFPAGDTNDWLAADLDPSGLAAVFSLSARAAGGAGWGELASNSIFALNHFHLAVTAEGTNILVRGTADFSRPLALDLKPWNIPTNLINWQVCSFTAMRGLQPWLKSLKAWNDLQIGPLPDQICFWAVPNSEMHSYFAAPLPEASNEVVRFTEWVLQNQGRRFPTNELSKFERSKEFNGLQWKGLPYMWPFLRSITVNKQNFIYGGGFPNVADNSTSLNISQAALNRADLVYYDWETTGPRIDQWIYMGQFARFVSHHAQLPPDSPALLWLKAIAPKLGYTVTRITETGPNQLSFTRRSSLGFTGIELNLLADWLESPRFPLGLHTLLAPPPKQ